ncbi:MAG: lipocalin family protein [Lentisphaeria bacterium]|nr:lipocalin family protein [Lentisphaeria bacterium]
MKGLTKYFLAPALLLLSGCSETVNIPAVTGFDAGRYMGTWYEIARLPNRFEKGMTEVSAEYSLRPDGGIKVVNSGMKDGEKRSVTGVAYPAGRKGEGLLKVSFFRPFYGAYRIIKLSPDYRYSVVTGSGMSYLWILARDRELPRRELEEIMAFLRAHRFAVKDLLWSWRPAETSASE